MADQSCDFVNDFGVGGCLLISSLHVQCLGKRREGCTQQWYRVINSHNNNKHIFNSSASRLKFGRELTESFWQFLMSTGTGIVV